MSATSLHRPKVFAMDAVLGKPIRVLDDGFLRVVDYMGDDAAIVQAARVSYGAGTKRIQTDRGLIRYLLRHSHTTPFEMCEIKFHLRVPMDCWRQWIRHRTASVNEYSTRYSLAIDSALRTHPKNWRGQSVTNRQGSAEALPLAIGRRLSASEAKLQSMARHVYEERLKLGVAREQARKDLPLSTYTEAYWKIDLHNLLHFLTLRMDAHAQHEIRAYATKIGEEIVSRWVPIAWQAFLDYGLGATHCSVIELEIIRALIRGAPDKATQIASNYGLVERDRKGKLIANRERADLDRKLNVFGLVAPWQ